MGLDNYASRTPGDVSLTPEDEAAFAGIELCGGIMSGGEASFRGKVYWDIVYDITEECLSDIWLPPETVALMASRLAERTPAELAARNDELDTYRDMRTNADEMANLQRFFAVCAERGLGIIAWA